MRTRSRSHASHLTLAALGLMASVVALASDPRPTPAVDASAASDAPSATIREVDFAAASQPGSACASGLDDALPVVIGVDAGSSGVLDPRTVTRLEIDDDIAYGDLDGDGREEAVVHATCHFGANGVQDTVQVWAIRRGQRVLVDTITEAPPAVAAGSRFPPAVLGVGVAGGEVEVTFSGHADDDPHCCPSQQTVVRYRLASGELETTGRAVTSSIGG